MKLYTMEDIIETLISVPDIKGAPYIELEEKLMTLKPAMIIPECGGCMGPSYNPRDCEECKNGYKDGQKDMLVFLLEGMKNALEKASNERTEE